MKIIIGNYQIVHENSSLELFNIIEKVKKTLKEIDTIEKDMDKAEGISSESKHNFLLIFHLLLSCFSDIYFFRDKLTLSMDSCRLSLIFSP